MTYETLPTRDAIVRATAELLAEGGQEAVTTRSVAAASGVQVPTIYRQFGDMHGLLDAVVSDELERYLERKVVPPPSDDPVDELRMGWDCNIGFGLSYPACYTLMWSDPRPDAPFTATAQTIAFLQGIVQRIAEAGRLRVDVAHATQMIHAACGGVVLTLLNLKSDTRDLALSSLTREAILTAIVVPPDACVADVGATAAHSPQHQLANRAVALKAVLPEVMTLTRCEQGLLSEWLDKLSQPER